MQADVESAVRSRFTVSDTYLLPDGEYEYRVDYQPDSGGKFVGLSKALDPLGFAPWLTGTPANCVLTVKKTAAPGIRRSRVPVVLALLSISTILLFSLLEELGDQKLAPSIPNYLAFFGFGLPVSAIVGARFLGHVYWVKRAGGQPNSSYLLPGVPGITASLPTLGFVTYQSAPAQNRDRYFDAMIIGPIAALVASVLLQVAGDLTAVQSSVQLTACQALSPLVSICPINPSIIQIAIGALVGPFAPQVTSGHALVTPIGDAATVGFLLVFVALLPMASFDGGHIASVLWGSNRARVVTYLSVAALLALDTNELMYWGVAIAVLLVGGRPLRQTFQDDVTRASKSRLLLYLLVLLVALLAVPIPQDIATVPLG